MVRGLNDCVRLHLKYFLIILCFWQFNKVLKKYDYQPNFKLFCKDLSNDFLNDGFLKYVISKS